MRKLRSFVLLLVVLFAVPFILTACGGKDGGTDKETGTEKTKLTAPANLTVRNDALVWTAVDNASGYKVEVNYGLDDTQTVSTNSFSVAGLEPDIYFYRVRAVGSGNYTDSDWSALYEHTVEAAEPAKYTVIWKNIDGTTLETDTDVAEGTTPSFDKAEDPTKAEDANFTYTFRGWLPAPAAITADTTYTAQFTAVPKNGAKAVTGLTVTGDGTMTVNAEKTFTADILPADATDKTVVWTVIAGTATITPAGDLTPTAVGTVTIRATAHNGIYGEKTITVNPIQRQAAAPTVVWNESGKMFIVTNNETAATWANYDFTLNGTAVTVTDGTGANTGKKVYDMTDVIAALGETDDGDEFIFAATVNTFTNGNYAYTAATDDATYTFEYDTQTVTETLVSIEPKVGTFKTEYEKNEVMDITGSKITLTYSTGRTEDIAVTGTMVSGFSTAEAGTDLEFTITYTHGGVTKTCTVPYEVADETVTPVTPTTDAEFAGFTKNGDTEYSIRVPSTLVNFRFNDYVSVDAGAMWVLTADISGMIDIPSKVVPLEIGDNTYYVLVKVAANGDTELYTLNIYRRTVYTVTFDTDGGTDIPAQEVEEDGLAQKPAAAPIRDRFMFHSWDFNFSTPITGDTTITANWTALYGYIYHANDGTNRTVFQDAVLDSSVTIKDRNTFTREHYTIAGWNTQADGTGTSYYPVQPVIYPVAADTDLYAVWEGIVYNIMFDLNGGFGIPTQSHFPYNTDIYLHIPYKTGYVFVAWQLNGVDFTATKMPGEDITLVAKWQQVITYEDALNTTFAEMTGADMESNAVGTMTVNGKALTMSPEFFAQIFGSSSGMNLLQKLRFDAEGNTNGYYMYQGDEDFEIWDNGIMYRAYNMEYIRYVLPVEALPRHAEMANRDEFVDMAGPVLSSAQNITTTPNGYEFDIDMAVLGDSSEPFMGNGTATLTDGKITKIGMFVAVPEGTGTISVAQMAEMAHVTPEEIMTELQSMGAVGGITDVSMVDFSVGMELIIRFFMEETPITDPAPTPPSGAYWTDRYTVTVLDLDTGETVAELYGQNMVSLYNIEQGLGLPIGTVCDGLYRDSEAETPIDIDDKYAISEDTTLYADIRTLDAEHTALLELLDKLENDTDFEVYYYENATESDNITVLQYAVDDDGYSRVVNAYQKRSDGAQAWTETYVDEYGTNTSYYYIDENGVHVKGTRIYASGSFHNDVFNHLPEYIKRTDTTVTLADGVYTVTGEDFSTVEVTVADNAITEIWFVSYEEYGRYVINGGDSKLVERPDKGMEWLPEFYTKLIFMNGEDNSPWGEPLAYITEEIVADTGYIDNYEVVGFYYDEEMTDALIPDANGLYFIDPTRTDSGSIVIYVKLTPKA